MTTTELRALTRKELETMAKRLNVPGRHAMKKEELVKILVSVRRKKNKTIDRKGKKGVSAANLKSGQSRGSNAQAASNGKKAVKNGPFAKPPAGKPNRLMASGNSENGSSPGGSKDRLTVQVLESHWLHAVWSLSRRIIDRARVRGGVASGRSDPSCLRDLRRRGILRSDNLGERY